MLSRRRDNISYRAYGEIDHFHWFLKAKSYRALPNPTARTSGISKISKILPRVETNCRCNVGESPISPPGAWGCLSRHPHLPRASCWAPSSRGVPHRGRILPKRRAGAGANAWKGAKLVQPRSFPGMPCCPGHPFGDSVSAGCQPALTLCPKGGLAAGHARKRTPFPGMPCCQASLWAPSDRATP